MKSEYDIIKDIEKNGCPYDKLPCENFVFGCGDCFKPTHIAYAEHDGGV